MHRVGFAPEAKAQLIALHRYIAGESSPAIAQRFTDAIYRYCGTLEEFPERGTPRDDIRPGVRTLSFRRRVIIAYDVTPQDVSIVGIFYGGQNFEVLLAGDDQDPN